MNIILMGAGGLPVYGSCFGGTEGVPASEVALRFVKSVEGAQTGRVCRIDWSRNT